MFTDVCGGCCVGAAMMGVKGLGGDEAATTAGKFTTDGCGVADRSGWRARQIGLLCERVVSVGTVEKVLDAEAVVGG